MIALLSYLSGWCQSSYAQSSFTGEHHNDSVLVSYDDLRVANAKMVELKYVKSINSRLSDIVSNDSIIQQQQSQTILKATKKVKRYKSQRNVLGGTSIIAILALVIVLL